MSTLKQANRIVVKVGTSTLTYSTGLLNLRRIEQLTTILSDLKNQGKEIILVSSGAIGVGMGKVGLEERPHDTRTKQACAAIGQCELMNVYDRHFSEFNHNVAQILLTLDVIEQPIRKKNVINTFNQLLSMNIIPIVNENDTVSVEEIEFGDNDTLSAIVAKLVGADLLIIMSDIDGLYDKDPNIYDDAKIIQKVTEIDEYILSLANGAGTKLGTGGMITKLHAAQYALNSGFPMVILNGSRPKNLYDLFDDKQVGTLFIKEDNNELH